MERALVTAMIALTAVLAPGLAAAEDGGQFVPGTAVLLSQSSGGSGSGGTSPTSSQTLIFSPAAYSD